MCVLRVSKTVRLLRETGRGYIDRTWLYSSHVRRMNFSVISLSLTLNMTIPFANSRKFYSQSQAAT